MGMLLGPGDNRLERIFEHILRNSRRKLEKRYGARMMEASVLFNNASGRQADLSLPLFCRALFSLKFHQIYISFCRRCVN